MASRLLLVACFCIANVYAAYIPKYLEGTPLSANVVSFHPPDLRGLPVYLIKFQVKVANGSTVDSFVHRNNDDFDKLHDKMPKAFWFWETDPWVYPRNTKSIATLNQFMQDIFKSDDAVKSETFADFLGINWNAQGIEWFKDFASFMAMVIGARVPDFPPEPPVFDSELDVLEPECPFEKYVYLKAFHHRDEGLPMYEEFFRNYTRITPKFEGKADNSDVWPPNAVAPIKLPYHYTKTYVHFLPGGYTNGQTVRISYCGYSKFNFLKEEKLKEWIQKVHGHRKPKRILDIGTGNCFSAFVYGEQFPDAEVIGIDLAAPYVRFCRFWKDKRGAKNVEFYQDNGELTHFDSNSFDIIQYTYVLHEMPAVNVERLLHEAMRLLKPGGVLSGFEVPYLDNPITRAAIVLSQTWGYRWNNTGPQGPEPYTREYQDKTIVPEMFKRVGYVNNTEYEYTIFDGIYLSYKPEV